MVITREHATGSRLRRQKAPPPLPEPSPRNELVRAASVRESARVAALETELRLLGRLAANSTIERLHPHLAVDSPFVSPSMIRMSERDARFQIPESRLREILRNFGTELERTESPSTLVVVAHQDDECIGAGAQLARLEDVTVVHVTTGAPDDELYAHRFGFSSAQEYGDARRREAERALELAGVPKERQLCLGIPDGQASHNLIALSLTIAELIEEAQPEILITHPYEGGHTDHDAIAFAVHLACGLLRREGVPSPAVLELTSYHNRNGSRAVHRFLPYEGSGPLRTVKLSREARELKARMYECFSTQRRCLVQFSVDVERFRAAPRYNFTRPPHEGQLDYERLNRRLSGAQWRAQAERALNQLRAGRRGRVSLAQPSTRTSSSNETTQLEIV